MVQKCWDAVLENSEDSTLPIIERLTFVILDQVASPICLVDLSTAETNVYQ